LAILDTTELQEAVKVRECQEKALQSLQAYTLAHYPDTPSKFGELLLRIPDLQRTCQVSIECGSRYTYPNPTAFTRSKYKSL